MGNISSTGVHIWGCTTYYTYSYNINNKKININSNPKNAEERIRHLINKSVKQTLMGRRKVGLFLSGGMEKDIFGTAIGKGKEFLGMGGKQTAIEKVMSNFDAQYQRLEQQRNLSILFAGESATARAEIERQYEEKRRTIEQRQAESQRDQAIFNVGIDTAQAIVATLAKTPPPAGLPLAALMAGIGAAQLVAIKSQQIPQFWMGTENGTPGGQIMVNDDPFGVKGSNYKEVVKEPSGKLHFPQGKNVKMNVPKGSKVYSTYDQFMNSLDRELMTNNIMPIGQSNIPPMIINQGLSKSDIKDVFSSEIGKLNSTIKNKKRVQIINDRFGQRVYETNQGKRTRIMNARYSGKGLDV